jgi:lincosamide nucleotidyltransferase A/C/D/E
MMTGEDVLAVMRPLVEAGVTAWLDGGWAVDAMVGEQTREHSDLDLVVELGAIDAIVGQLSALGYEPTEDARPVRFVLSARDGRSIDIHTVTWDEGGGGLQPQPNGTTFRYPPEGFAGRGMIAGVELPCLTPEVQILCHMGYEPADTDRHDVQLLAETFGLELPSEYR